MMSGLMLVFLFIAIGFMIEVQSQKDAMRDVAVEFKDTQSNLNEKLFSTFENDLENWNATLTSDNKIIFNSPDVLFEVGTSEVSEKFKTILDDFFPRFLETLQSDEFKNEIQEVRIEGHTSKSWGDLTDAKQIYLKNMNLSQERAYEVLKYCYLQEDEKVIKNRAWLEENLRANGMSFSMFKEEQTSRRVEFVVVLKTEDKLQRILK